MTILHIRACVYPWNRGRAEKSTGTKSVSLHRLRRSCFRMEDRPVPRGATALRLKRRFREKTGNTSLLSRLRFECPTIMRGSDLTLRMSAVNLRSAESRICGESKSIYVASNRMFSTSSPVWQGRVPGRIAYSSGKPGSNHIALHLTHESPQYSPNAGHGINATSARASSGFIS